MAKKLPGGVMLIIALALTAVVGYIDWITGDYSMLIFYMIPVAIGAWHLGRWGSVLIAVLSGLARFISDFTATSNHRVLLWNTLEDTLFLILVGILIAYLKNVLDKESRH